MRVFIAVLVLIFSLQSLTKADDISDFEIEGMSIGDSALQYVNKEFIEKESYNYPGDDNLFVIFNIDKYNNTSFNFEIYNGVHINYKKNDPKFIIHSLRAKIYFNKNIEECYSLKKNIIIELEKELIIIKKYGGKNKHWTDKSGKSIVDSTFLDVKGGRAVVQCYDWSEDIEKWDNLSVSISAAEYAQWIDDRS